MRTRAVRDGDEWVISGAKNWTSNASTAEFYVVFAMTDSETRRITAFIVEADRPGFAVGKLEHKLGIRGMPTASLTFRRGPCPGCTPRRRGRQGPRRALATLERSRLGAAAQVVGISLMGKLFASDTAMEVTIEAVQVVGGYGYVSDYPVERMMRDAKITQIYEGTNEIQRLVIGRVLAR